MPTVCGLGNLGCIALSVAAALPTIDRNSRPKRHTDGRGNETSLQYDDLDRVERVRLADATEWSYLHDGDGNLLQSLDPNGSLVTRRYDGLSRALEVTVVPGAGVEGTRRQTFAWDGLSRSLELVDDNGSSVGPVGSTGLVAVASLLEQRWDSLSRPLSETQDGRTIAWSYHPDDVRRNCLYPSGRELLYTRDPLDRLEDLAQVAPGETAATQVASFEYFGPGRLARRTSGNGLSLLFQEPGGEPGYDRIKRPTRLAHAAAAPAAPVLGFRSAYDRASDRTSIEREHDGLLKDLFGYDSARRLVSSLFDQPPAAPQGTPAPLPRVARGLASRTYGLDAASNRVSVSSIGPGGVATISTYTADRTNAYTLIESRSGVAPITSEELAYDRNGNLTQDGKRRCVYDAFNRLHRLITATTETVYSYDATGRRVRAETAPLASGASPAVTVRFFHDGLRCVEETTQVAHVSTTVREYLHGADLDEVVLSVVAPVGTSARSYWHHEDPQGSTAALSDAAGNLVDEVAYDEWGVPYFRDAAAHALAGNPVLFQGHRLDPESGLYHLRARQYDPEKGRFLQRDPLGVWGDPLNLGNPYTFAGQNPLTQGDPLGLMTVVQLDRGFHSVEEELAAVRATRDAEYDSWRSSPAGTAAFWRAQVREAELLGRRDDLELQVSALVNSWQFRAGLLLTENLDDGFGWLAEKLHARTRGADPVLETEFALALDPADELSLENCWLAGTLVVVRGPGDQHLKKPIEEVQVGDEVWASDPRRGWSGWAKVSELYRNETDYVVSVVVAPLRQQGSDESQRVGAGGEVKKNELASAPDMERAQVLQCTPGHPWWVESDGEYRPAAELSPGDVFLLQDGRAGVVLQVQVRPWQAKTFNLGVAGWRTYFVAGGRGEPGVLVHNASLYARALALARRLAGAPRNVPTFASRPVPHGFVSRTEFVSFGASVRRELRAAGHHDVTPILQGSAVTGRSFPRPGRPSRPFDVGRVSDFDIALASPTLLQKAAALGIGLRGGGTRTGPLSPRDLKRLGLLEAAQDLSQLAGRTVNFMIYGRTRTALSRGPSIRVP